MDRRTRAELLRRLEQDALRICSRFGLRYRVLEAERANVRSRYGVCYSDGTIRIRLRHATTGRPLKYSSLVNTLCHELAHLRHFNHGPRFQLFYGQILEWARHQGIYRPGPTPVAPAERPLRATAAGGAAGVTVAVVSAVGRPRRRAAGGGAVAGPKGTRGAESGDRTAGAPPEPRQLDLFG